VFGKTNIQFGYMDYDSDYTAIIVHLEWNLIFFVGVRMEKLSSCYTAVVVIAYNMHNRKVHVIPTHYSQFLKHGILPKINGRPYYLPYVPLFSE